MDHIANRDLVRRLGQYVPAARPPGARDDTGTPQPEQDLLDIIAWQALDPRDLATVDRPQLGSLRQMESANHPILGPRRYPHSNRIEISFRSDKGIGA